MLICVGENYAKCTRWPFNQNVSLLFQINPQSSKMKRTHKLHRDGSSSPRKTIISCVAVNFFFSFLLVTLGEDWNQKGARATGSQSRDQSHLFVRKSCWGPQNSSLSSGDIAAHQKGSTSNAEKTKIKTRHETVSVKLGGFNSDCLLIFLCVRFVDGNKSLDWLA